MMRPRPSFCWFPFLLLALPLGARPLRSQQFQITWTDGTASTGVLEQWKGEHLQLRSAAAEAPARRAGAETVLFLHGPATTLRTTGAAMLHLNRGVVLCGDVLGGDEDGESLTLKSTATGIVRVPLDALWLIRLRQRDRFYAVKRFEADPGDESKESVFRDTQLGLDPLHGILDRVSEKGVHFEWRDNEEADLFPWKSLAGVRLPHEPAKIEPPALEVVLLTSDGCRVRGQPAGIEKGRLRLATLELGEIRVSLEHVLAGHVVHDATRVFLSALQPKKVAERTFWRPEPDLPWRANESVAGLPLSVRRRRWTTGLGCHSLSRLSFVVPAGAKRFRCWVGADDTAVGEDVIGDMDFRVFVADKVVAQQLGVKGGQAVQALPEIAVTPGDVVLLELGFAGFADILDRGNWLAPVFLK